MRYQIEVSLLEFDDNGHTLWIHNAQGSTVLRIKCAHIEIDSACSNNAAHADIQVVGPITICIPSETP